MGDVTAPQAPPAPAQGAKGQPFLRDLLRRLIRERPVGAVSAAIVLLLCLVAIFADVLAPFHFMDMTMSTGCRARRAPTRWAPTTSVATSSAACCTRRGCRSRWGSPPPP